jgi:glycosyltransferase involved in cell wall biosynthesis
LFFSEQFFKSINHVIIPLNKINYSKLFCGGKSPSVSRRNASLPSTMPQNEESVCVTENERPDISVIAPAFNEEGNVGPLIERIHEVFAITGYKYEAVIVDDCSTDSTPQKLAELQQKYPWVRVIRLEKNSGQTAAMEAGFKFADGKVFGTCDADMQNDPAEILRLMTMLAPDVDMVNGWRKDRKDKNRVMRWIQTKIANGIRNWLSGDNIKDSACGLKVYKRETIHGLTLYKGMHRFFPTLVKMRGYKVIEVPISHHPRFAGTTKYKFGSRVFRAFVDLLAVRWMKKRAIRYVAKELRPADILKQSPQEAEAGGAK